MYVYVGNVDDVVILALLSLSAWYRYANGFGLKLKV